VKWGFISRNPTDLVTPPKPKKKAPITLSEGEVEAFLKSIEHHQWYPIYVLAIGTGMREGEIFGLRHEDLSLDVSSLQVTQTVYSIRGKTHIGEPKSDKSRRTIALPDYVVEVLKSIEPGSGLLFTTSSGRPISPRNLLRHFHESLAKAGLPRVTFHSLRHFHATYLLKRNIHPKIVQERLGHSTISLTMDTYSHVIPDIQKEATEKIDDIFKA
jgi:integrase